MKMNIYDVIKNKKGAISVLMALFVVSGIIIVSVSTAQVRIKRLQIGNDTFNSLQAYRDALTIRDLILYDIKINSADLIADYFSNFDCGANNWDNSKIPNSEYCIDDIGGGTFSLIARRDTGQTQQVKFDTLPVAGGGGGADADMPEGVIFEKSLWGGANMDFGFSVDKTEFGGNDIIVAGAVRDHGLPENEIVGAVQEAGALYIYERTGPLPTDWDRQKYCAGDICKYKEWFGYDVATGISNATGRPVVFGSAPAASGHGWEEKRIQTCNWGNVYFRERRALGDWDLNTSTITIPSIAGTDLNAMDLETRREFCLDWGASGFGYAIDYHGPSDTLIVGKPFRGKEFEVYIFQRRQNPPFDWQFKAGFNENLQSDTIQRYLHGSAGQKVAVVEDSEGTLRAFTQNSAGLVNHYVENPVTGVWSDVGWVISCRGRGWITAIDAEGDYLITGSKGRSQACLHKRDIGSNTYRLTKNFQKIEPHHVHNKFGRSVSIDNGLIAIGDSHYEWIGPVGSGNIGTGAAYLYDCSGGRCDSAGSVNPDLVMVGDYPDITLENRDWFGFDVVVDNGQVVVGAMQDGPLNTGAWYMFDYPPP